MLVTIDTDQLVRDAATYQMDDTWAKEAQCITHALINQLPEGINLKSQVRQQVKEYKKLTMWRD